MSRDSLFHYAYKPIEAFGAVPQPKKFDGHDGSDKPIGIWFATGEDWKEASADHRDAASFAYRYRVVLKDVMMLNDPRPHGPGQVLRLNTPEEAALFAERFIVAKGNPYAPTLRIDWRKVSTFFDGIFVNFEYGRLRFKDRDKIEFLYCWDVRGGCTWNPRNVDMIDVATGVEVPKVAHHKHWRHAADEHGRIPPPDDEHGLACLAEGMPFK